MESELVKLLLNLDGAGAPVTHYDGFDGNIFAEAAETISALRDAADGNQLAEVWKNWTAYQEAATPVTQASALLTFANSFYHYTSSVLGFAHVTDSTQNTEQRQAAD